MKIYPEKVWIDVDRHDKPFILHNEATMGMCAYIRSDIAHAASLREPLGNEKIEDIADKVLNMSDEQIRAVLILEKRCPNCAANETKATIIQALYDHVKKGGQPLPSPPSTKPEEKE